MTFILSKLLWSVVAPGSLLAYMLVVGILLGFRPRFAQVGRVLCGAAAVGFLALSLLPVGDWALAPLENRTQFLPPEKVDGIVVLGGDERAAIYQARGIPVALDSMRRLAHFADLARRYPEAKLVFSGGSPAIVQPEQALDSIVAEKLLTSLAVPQERMFYERRSRNTYENAVFSAELMKPQPGEHWLLVTSAWHMPRALACFRAAGWPVSPAPTGYFTTGLYRFSLPFEFAEQTRNLSMALHEYIGLVSYWLMGRITSPWPQ